MSRKRVSLSGHARRAVLTDMLPFEVPPTFSNRGFHRFLQQYLVDIDGSYVRWVCSDASVDVAIRLIFGIDQAVVVETATEEQWGGKKTIRRLKITAKTRGTIPLLFTVSHNDGGRSLGIPHPRNQVDVSDFYQKDGALILYYTSLSMFSIRRPVSISKYAYFVDGMHERYLDFTRGVELVGREYEKLGSYFVYARYRNIHRFFESDEYHRCEKKFDTMIQLDVSKCFDSIYTHSVVWAVFGKAQTKFHLEQSKETFAGRFDALMQNLNYKETNGILIGPEFSRIFAEVILQAVDVELVAELEKLGVRRGRDYEIFRYVDDYFVFCSKEDLQRAIVEELQELLRSVKLSINPAKMRKYSRPVITELTMAKDRVASVLSEEIDPRVETIESPPGKLAQRFTCSVRSSRLIVRYKTVIKVSGVEYTSVLNYTLAILENKLESILKSYAKSERSAGDKERMVEAVLEVLKFSFFIFAASPKVNHSVRLCRLITASVDFLRAAQIPYDLKHLVFRYVHDSIMEQLDKYAMGIHYEVESLYLLISLGHIGREYWLPESVLARHFRIVEKGGSYHRDAFLGHFGITVLLSYMQDKLRYKKLRTFVIDHAIMKVKDRKAECLRDTECLLLFLDLLVCPYVPNVSKDEIAASFGIGPASAMDLRSISEYWFTAWGEQFSLSRELEAKRSREVY